MTETTDTKVNKLKINAVDLNSSNIQDIEEYLHNDEVLNVAFENAPISIALVDLQGNILRVNKTLPQIFGYSKKELTSMNFKELSLPDELEVNLKLMDEAIEGKRDSYQMEKRYKAKDGKIIWGLLKATLVRDNQGDPLFFIGQVQDISKQKQTELALKQGEEKFRLTFENAPIGKSLVSIDGRFKEVNTALCKVLGFTSQELKNKTFKDITHPDDMASSLDLASSLLSGEIDKIETEKRYISKNGKIVWALLKTVLMYDNKNKPQYFISQVVDITEQKRSEQALKESEEKYRKLIDFANDAIFLAEADTGILVEANEKAGELIGIPHDKIIGMHQMQLHPPEKADEYKRIFKEYVGKSKGVTPELLALHKSGRKIPIEISSTVINLGGKIYLQGIFRDITERKIARELSDALNKINAAINSTLNHNKIMEKVVVEAAKAMGCDASAIIEIRDDLLQINHSFGLPISKDMLISSKDIACSMRAVKENRVLIDDHTHDDDGNACCSLIHKYNISSKLSAPLSIKGKVLGVIDFYYLKKPVPFSRAQIDFAKKLASSMSLAIENARLYQTECNIANTLQEAVLNVPESISGLEFGHFYRSATETAKVGGDFYDIFEIDDKRIGITIGDVSGKGIKAASLTSVVKNTIRAYAYQRYSTAHIVKMTNSITIKQGDPAHFVTAFFGILDKETGILSYCSCGHPPSIIKRKSSTIELLKTSSSALGLIENNDFVEETAKLDKNDILILYTDGVTEARCLSKKGTNCGFYGENRLIDFIENEKNANSKTLAKKIFKSIMSCTGCVLTDDVVVCTLSLK